MPADRDTGKLILCHDCGKAALVPFEPAEGRRVFCPPCYRRRVDEERQYGDRPHDPRRPPRPLAGSD
jgi:CxxC-x17-CxxC domain-containing protein